MAYFRSLLKNGASIGVTLPREFLQAMGLKHRDPVMLELVDGTIVISRVVSEREAISRLKHIKEHAYEPAKS